MIRFAELFAGIGGFREGLEKCSTEKQGEGIQGIRDTKGECGKQPNRSTDRFYYCVWSNELDKYASAIYRYRYGNICETDIRTVDAESVPDHDLLTFGWPCQDNSVAGQRNGQREGTRSGLLFSAIRILRAKTPKYFIAENVPGLFSVNEGYDFYETIRLFTEIGYDVQWQVLNTRWFLPQNRKRIYFVGHLRGEPRPQVFPIGETSQTYRKGDGTVACAIDANYGKGFLDHGQRTMIRTRSDQEYKYAETEPSLRQSDKGEVLIHTAFPDGMREYTDCSPTISTPSGGGHLPMVLHKTSGQSVTIKYNETGCLQSGGSNVRDKTPNVVMETGIRRLTPIEAERLQGFPDDWTKYGLFEDGQVKEISDTQRYKCLGNAVSVPVVRCVAEKLLKAIEANK